MQAWQRDFLRQTLSAVVSQRVAGPVFGALWSELEHVALTINLDK